MKRLIAHAASLGVHVHVAHLPFPYRGFYDAERCIVVYGFDLTPIERRCVLAHELGHAFYGHQCRDDHRAELAADIYAARLLIDPRKLAALEAVCADPEWLAEELRVEVRLLEVYARHVVVHLDGVAYAGSRLGRSQYHHVELREAL